MDNLWENMYGPLEEGKVNPSYLKRFKKKGGQYIMTSEEFASHMHYLNWYVEWKKK